VRRDDTAFAQQFLDTLIDQNKPIEESNAVTDDFTREAVILLALGVGWRDHDWLPILVFNRSQRGHHEVSMIVNKLTTLHALLVRFLL
jgi:hypothetical protein